MNLKQRVRRDARRVAGDAEASALLECLVEHLFEPDLDALFLRKACGATREARARLAKVVGTLKDYVTRLRMIEAERLVRETRMKNPEIAERLGYRVERTFRRAFVKIHKVRPSEMRRQARAEGAGAEGAGDPDPVAAATSALEKAAEGENRAARERAVRSRRRAVASLLDAKAAGELRAELRRRHPALAETAAEAREDPAREEPAQEQLPMVLNRAGHRLEWLAATAVFDRILALPEEDLRFAMLDGVRIASSTAFDALRMLCYGHSRWNPERAVAVAELGVQLIEIQRDLVSEQEGDGLKAQAWSFLGRVQMLAGDVAAADRAIGFAWEEVGRGTNGTNGTMVPWAEVDVRRLEGTVRIFQGRDAEAAVALDRAVELGRGLHPTDPDRLDSVYERLELASRLGEPEVGLRLAGEVEELVETHGAGFDRKSLWRGLTAYHRGKAHAATGRDDLAREAWLAASRHTAPGPDGAAQYEIVVAGAFVVHELARLAGRGRHLDVYETLLRDAIGRYRLARVPVVEAAAEAELAALCALRGQDAEARRLAASAADFLDDLPSHRRAWNVSRWLRALAEGATAPVRQLRVALAGICRDLDHLRWQIGGVQAMPAAEARDARA